MPEKLAINRLGGQFLLNRSQERFDWNANNFRLDRIEVAISPDKCFKRIFGQLSGNGSFDLSPLELDGEMTLRYPRYMGLRLKEAQFKGNYLEKDFIIKIQNNNIAQWYLFAGSDGLINEMIDSQWQQK